MEPETRSGNMITRAGAEDGEGDEEVDDEVWLDEYDNFFRVQKGAFTCRIERKEGDYLLGCASCLILLDGCSCTPKSHLGDPAVFSNLSQGMMSRVSLKS